MFAVEESVAPMNEPTESERAALGRLARITRETLWIIFGGFAAVGATAFVGETLFTIAALVHFTVYLCLLGRIIMFRCPRCGGSYRLGRHGFDRRYPRDRCTNGCGLLYKPD